MFKNVPDDWYSCYTYCPRCGHKVHMSEVDACPCNNIEEYDDLVSDPDTEVEE
jgi:NADH pyrophosphatase NudC (nudix superfamily)